MRTRAQIKQAVIARRLREDTPTTRSVKYFSPTEVMAKMKQMSTMTPRDPERLTRIVDYTVRGIYGQWQKADESGKSKIMQDGSALEKLVNEMVEAYNTFIKLQGDLNEYSNKYSTSKY